MGQGDQKLEDKLFFFLCTRIGQQLSDPHPRLSLSLSLSLCVSAPVYFPGGNKIIFEKQMKRAKGHKRGSKPQLEMKTLMAESYYYCAEVDM